MRPDSQRNVGGLRNAVSLLVATRAAARGADGLQDRVRAHRAAIASILDSAAKRADDMSKVRRYVREEVASQACRGEIVLDAAPVRRMRPRPCGYWVAAGASDAIERLQLLGVQVDTMSASEAVLGTVYQGADAAGSSGQRITLLDALVDMPPGSYHVTLAQPLANLAIAALEPDTPHSLNAGGLLRLADVARLRAQPKAAQASDPAASEPTR
jgi:hypothetical protein